MPKKRKYTRLTCGAAPPPPYTLLDVSEDEVWHLYRRDAVSTSRWVSLKLAAMPGTRGKANYWLGWNGERLAVGQDAKCLEEHHPGLRDWVVEVLTDPGLDIWPGIV